MLLETERGSTKHTRPFQFLGTVNGRAFVYDGVRRNWLDEQGNKLQAVSIADKLRELSTRKGPHRPDDPLNLVREVLDRVELYEREFGRPDLHEHWQHLKLPDGTCVLGGNRYAYPNERCSTNLHGQRASRRTVFRRSVPGTATRLLGPPHRHGFGGPRL